MQKLPDELKKIKTIYIDDEEFNLDSFTLTFKNMFNIFTATSVKQALEIMNKENIGLVITDEKMPEMSGIEFLKVVVKKWPDTHRIIISAYSDPDRLFRAINIGHVNEYISKPWDEEELYEIIVSSLKQIQKKQLLKSHAKLSQINQKDYFVRNNLIYASEAMKKIVKLLDNFSKKNVPVLLTGESGTGKEVVAKLIHESSNRNNYPFVAINCAAIPDNLLEDELFGHEKGAFTDAKTMKQGKIELADQGTLFLDEIGDISPKLQVNLLRVLQEHQFERLGGTKTINSDFRLITATNRNLKNRIAQGKFREDLLYRLNVVPIHIQPLHERKDDIEPLFRHFINKYKKQFDMEKAVIADDVIPKLKEYNWPGNVRELENAVQRALAVSSDGDISVKSFFFDLEAVNLDEAITEDKDEFLKKQDNDIKKH